MSASFVRIDFDGSGGDISSATLDGRRKLRFRHKDLRDAVESTKKSIRELLDDPWGGWPYLLYYGLREQDPKITLDKSSALIDAWCESHPDEEAPMNSLGGKLREAFEAAGFIRSKPQEDAAEPAEKNDPAGQ
jgi:hypothetical protein